MGQELVPRKQGARLGFEVHEVAPAVTWNVVRLERESIELELVAIVDG
jgi:hypothetical protein